ncbi:thiamine biosynthesis protein ThiS [Saccharobesus litoralis]|uniref:Thiamine biosynthesis protein ThiS n=1 Tax=Saccharobesus litoralis TaxID=2172099 RepID=A0A2S0VNL3_9ALTE|nr:sulfur carrier protein ThiS [Saccharobesus litoralis]AWB65772.1 thiamine biosynthesis protein ThiS [Saccharobesus litoralis]
MIAIQLNGQSQQVTKPDLAALIAQLPNNKGLAVAVNFEVIPQNMWPEFTLQAGDKVDVFQAIAGG